MTAMTQWGRMRRLASLGRVHLSRGRRGFLLLPSEKYLDFYGWTENMVVMEALLMQPLPSYTPGVRVWTIRSTKVVLDMVDGPLTSIPPFSVLSCMAESGKLNTTFSRFHCSFHSVCKLSSSHSLHLWDIWKAEVRQRLSCCFQMVFCLFVCLFWFFAGN